MIYVSLTQTQRDEFTSHSHRAIGRVALRAQMVLLSDRGFTVPQIATIHACGQDVVRIWLHRYQQHGVAGLEDEPSVSASMQGSAGGHDRGCPGEPIASLLGACPDLLER